MSNPGLGITRIQYNGYHLSQSLHYVSSLASQDTYNPSKSPFEKGDFRVAPYRLTTFRAWLAISLILAL